MMTLFRGFSGAHGTHGAEETRTGAVKREIKKSAKTLREPVTLELWEQHLSGQRALGIITITEEATCWWSALDIDKYDIVHLDLVKELAERKIPAVVCRTKSGGAHIYLFFSEAIPAGEVMAKMRELASSLGQGGCEIFPKQDQVLTERGDLGNWLNMPYFDSAHTVRYAIGEDGRGLSLSRFLSLAERSQLTAERLASLPLHRSVPEMVEGPPCLEHLASTGIGEGARNNGLFALGVLAKKMQPDDWAPLLEKYNADYLRPPLPAAEVQVIIKSLGKRDYSYKCGDTPINAHCNLAVCRGRKFGVGPSGAARIVESVSILETEPPLFFVNLRTGGTVECEAGDLLNPRAFQQLALTQLLQVLPQYKQEDWHRQIQSCIEDAVRIQAPREVGITGQFEELLERFCTDRHAATTKDEILLGKPWLDQETGLVWFRLRDLQDMLDRHKFRELTRGKITSRLRQMGGDAGFFNIRSKGTNVWSVPADRLNWLAAPLETPREEDSAI